MGTQYEAEFSEERFHTCSMTQKSNHIKKLIEKAVDLDQVDDILQDKGVLEHEHIRKVTREVESSEDRTTSKTKHSFKNSRRTRN